MKKFNTTAVCIPAKHYMVDLDTRVAEIKNMVDEGKYFTINRARQYGKTTILNMLKNGIRGEYDVLSLDFQGLSSASYSTENKFCRAFAGLILNCLKFGFLSADDKIYTILKEYSQEKENQTDLNELFCILRKWCKISEKGLVLIIDEVDSAANNQIFLDFLAQLRDGYILRDTEGVPTFQSVILAGVSDIKHLKSQVRDDGLRRVNSPWNVAADFNVDMSFHAEDIKSMLIAYEMDHSTGMDIDEIALEIEGYTGGYPFLVSRICQLIDERMVPDKFKNLSSAWTKNGIDEAVKMILMEDNTLFDSLMGKLTNFPSLKEKLRRLLMRGEPVDYLPDDEEQKQLRMYGFIRRKNNAVAIDNRIFETRLYNMFLGEAKSDDSFRSAGGLDKNIFIRDGVLNMPLILERFIATYHQVFGELTDKFKEKDGRELFLLYLKPIINGTGNYYIEAQTRTQTRMDVVVDYLGKQYVVELKIWRGESYNKEGEKQIRGYLNYFGLDVGYMLSFNFNKKKEVGVKRVQFQDKVVFEGML